MNRKIIDENENKVILERIEEHLSRQDKDIEDHFQRQDVGAQSATLLVPASVGVGIAFAGLAVIAPDSKLFGGISVGIGVLLILWSFWVNRKLLRKH